MKKLLVFTFLIAVIFASANASVSSNKKDVIGEWKYEVPTAPYGYEAGTIVVIEEEGKLAGHIKLADGYKIDLKSVTFEEGIFKCGLYVDYEYITIKAKIEGETLTGAVDSPEGEMKITAKKVK